MKKNKTKKSRRNKILASILGFVFLISSLSAVYLMNFQKDITGEIVEGDKGFGVSVDLENFVINASEDLTHSQELIISNRNGNIPMQYNLTTELNSNDVLCDLSGDDLTTEFYYDGVLINSGENITLVSGDNVFTLNNTANSRACPLSANLSIELSEI